MIDVWYENPETGVPFGFSLPLHPVIADQVASGKLREIPAPPVPEDSDGSSSAASRAAGLADDDTEEEPAEPALHVCEECGGTVTRPRGATEWPTLCAKHRPKAGK